MFPYRDDNPTILTPVVTVALILANAAVWLLVQGLRHRARAHAGRSARWA